jgi:hypothetical protein
MKSAGGTFCIKLNFRIFFNTGIVIVTIVYEYELRNDKRFGRLLGRTFLHCKLSVWPTCASHVEQAIPSEKCFLLSRLCLLWILPQNANMSREKCRRKFCKQKSLFNSAMYKYDIQNNENNELWVPSWTKIKLKNMYFSWMLHGLY